MSAKNYYSPCAKYQPWSEDYAGCIKRLGPAAYKPGGITYLDKDTLRDLAIGAEAVIDKANPKDRIGVTKAPLDFFPPVAMLKGAAVLAHGAEKYGRANWRDYKVKRTVYLAAALRHIMADLDGETIDPESGHAHIDHALAGLAVLIDADSMGQSIDDRPKAGAYADKARTMYPTEKKNV